MLRMSNRGINERKGLRRRAGMTLMEVMIVVSTMMLVTAIALPRLGEVRTSANVQSAATEVAGRIQMARQAAIRRGAGAVFHHAGGKAWVTVDKSGASIVIGDTLRLNQKYGASLTAAVDSVRYTSRGFAKLGTSQTFAISRYGVSQSVCITAAGLVMSRGCTL